MFFDLLGRGQRESFYELIYVCANVCRREGEEPGSERGRRGRRRREERERRFKNLDNGLYDYDLGS